MFLQAVQPHLLLAPYIQSLWISKMDFGNPGVQTRIIAPNARVKIVVPFEDDLIATSDQVHQRHPEGQIQFIGNADKPYLVQTEGRRSGTLIIELTAQGACRFVPFAMHEITNNIVLFKDIYGAEGKSLEQRIMYAADPIAKADLLQQFLIKQLHTENTKQQIVDYVVRQLQASNGCLRIQTLEKKTGYSKRYLDMLFKQYVGLAPKTIASIARFQYFHILWAKNPNPGFYGNEIYSFYHDQAHFIKEFKRFSGLTPEQYAVTDNELGRIFYRD